MYRSLTGPLWANQLHEVPAPAHPHNIYTYIRILRQQQASLEAVVFVLSATYCMRSAIYLLWRIVLFRLASHHHHMHMSISPTMQCNILIFNPLPELWIVEWRGRSWQRTYYWLISIKINSINKPICVQMSRWVAFRGHLTCLVLWFQELASWIIVLYGCVDLSADRVE